jgi:hypothetical protein
MPKWSRKEDWLPSRIPFGKGAPVGDFSEPGGVSAGMAAVGATSRTCAPTVATGWATSAVAPAWWFRTGAHAIGILNMPAEEYRTIRLDGYEKATRFQCPEGRAASPCRLKPQKTDQDIPSTSWMGAQGR